MDPRATKLAEAYSTKLLQHIYERSITNAIVNREYEGEVMGVGSIVNIMTLGKVSEQTYTGTNLSVEELLESNSQLSITERKSFYFKIKAIDNFESFIKAPLSTVETQKANERLKNIDSFVLGHYGDVAAGNRVGTNYVTGDVTIDDSGNVTGNGTTFTSAMVGKGFRATGHSKWYRIKSFSSTTAIVIENDSDDEESAYDGGAIGGGSSYIIQANAAVTLDVNNIRSYIGKLKIILDNAEVPMEDRWIVVPTEVEDLITQGGNIQLAVPAAYDDLVKRGMITQLLGFNVFTSTRLSGNNTDGFHILAGSKMWQTHADKQLESGIEDLHGNFGDAYKDLFVYGSKVPDVRRKFAAELFAKV